MICAFMDMVQLWIWIWTCKIGYKDQSTSNHLSMENLLGNQNRRLMMRTSSPAQSSRVQFIPPLWKATSLLLYNYDCVILDVEPMESTDSIK
ncbi:hypothetical protein M0802_011664 [Mischocyttarus mexicanus]|nr:hypothetical protein M0802_011664 [Mischocyttarus mexicanus]